MTYRTRLLRLAAIGLTTLATLAATALALPNLAAQSAGPRPDLDGLWAQVGGLEAWYYANGYTDSPPPAAPATQPRSPIASFVAASSTLTRTAYLPLIAKNHRPIEFRGVWVSRFDWTGFGITPTTATIDAIVSNVQAANFNAILFQVRGTGDAYYTPGLEPWAARMTGGLTKTLGVDPGWDPLAYLATQAHAKGIQVHAYINVFPTWLCGLGAPPNPVTPTHLFWSLSYSTTWANWRAWTTSGPDTLDACSDYLWATPALTLTRAHVAAIAADLVTRYAVDGIHLDLVRYPGSGYSHDPFTRQAYTDALAISPTLTFAQWQPDFQRAQVSNLVSQVYASLTAARPEAWLSAAVWPNYSSGYASYFQDSKGWLAAGIVDANLPMLYSSDIVNDLAAWTTRMQGFVAESYGRYVIPGIHADYASFGDLAARIEAARAAGAPGVAIFSYGALNARGYFDDLGAGPFASPADVPRPGWKP
jgi:uncharacterized lipoprotein YddW (UPF0748 family)